MVIINFQKKWPNIDYNELLEIEKSLSDMGNHLPKKRFISSLNHLIINNYDKALLICRKDFKFNPIQ